MWVYPAGPPQRASFVSRFCLVPAYRKSLDRIFHPRISWLLKWVGNPSMRPAFTAGMLFITMRIALGLFDDDMISYGTYVNSETSDVSIDDVVIGTRADWGPPHEVPDFCKRIMVDPQPFRRECKRNPRNMSCSNFPDEILMFSQFKQDFYLFTRHFVDLKRRGVYLDVATNEPVGISNTFFMDRCLQWKGACVEGNPMYYERIHRLRSCHIVPTCVGRRDGETVNFGLSGGNGGIMGVSNKHMEKWAQEKVQVPMIRERCTTVQRVLDRGNIRVVDYLSLDVEGHELEVLMGVDWMRTQINVLSIEVSATSLIGIEKWMKKIGYKRHFPELDDKSMRSGRLGGDVIFLHPAVVFGSPR